MFTKRMLSGAMALALLGLVGTAQAVQLGKLTVESQPGEPLAAVLEIDDLDLSISPLLVRVAPPATYLREGVTWPSQAQDLKMARDSGSSSVRLRVYSAQPMTGEAFPLLIEMNAGGTVTVRRYQISTQDGRFVVAPSAVKTTVQGGPKREVPEPLVVPKAKETQSEALVAKANPQEEKAPAIKETPKPVVTKAEKTAEPKVDPQEAPKVQPKTVTKAKTTKLAPTTHVRKGRYAPNVVREYVALNGFDASEPFRVQEDMTLWSVAKLYWPAYRGSTMEQMLIAFRNANKTSFINGDPSLLGAGTVLNPPSAEAVFAIDPVVAFREVRGDNEVIPLATQNLIDAQLISTEVAGKVADAQDRERATGHGPQEVAQAGRYALEEQKAEISHERQLMSPDGGDPIGEPRPKDPHSVASPVTAEPVDEVPAPTTETKDAPIADTGTPVATTEPVAQKAEPAPVTPIDEKVLSASEEKTLPTDEKGLSKAALWGGGALILALLAFFGLRSRKSEEGEPEAKKPMTVSIQKNVHPTSKAQLTALEMTVNEAVKNGTTAGAMGAGSMAYAMAKQEEEREQASKVKSEQAASDAVNQLTNEQPWLAPDDELPPLDADDTRSPEATAKAAKQTASVIDAVTLDLDDDVEPKAAVDATTEVIDTKPDESTTLVPESDKERALWQALDAKLKLASSFVGLGALTEALELLDEVKRRGNPDQRERALFLEDRIKSRTDEETK